MDTNNVIRILEKWSKKYKRSIDCSNPKGFSQRAHCAGRKKRKSGGKTKSRPVESFNREITMENLKEFVINEIEKTLTEEVSKNNVRKSAKTLFEAVNTLSEMKKKGDSNKIKVAESVVSLAERKLNEDYDEYDGDCDCGEGEGRMMKAQLLSIMDRAQKLYHMIDEEDQFEDWVQSKVTVAEDYIRACYGYMVYYNGGDEAEFGDDDWDEDEDDYDMYDDVDEDDDYDQPMMNVSSISSALDPNVDDEMFEQKK